MVWACAKKGLRQTRQTERRGPLTHTVVCLYYAFLLAWGNSLPPPLRTSFAYSATRCLVVRSILHSEAGISTGQGVRGDQNQRTGKRKGYIFCDSVWWCYFCFFGSPFDFVWEAWGHLALPLVAQVGSTHWILSIAYSNIRHVSFSFTRMYKMLKCSVGTAQMWNFPSDTDFKWSHHIYW